MTDLATAADYTVRYGTPAAPERVDVLLAEASSFVRQVAGLHISLVEDESIEVRARRGMLILPEFPVVDVTSIEAPGPTPLDPSSYEWTPAGIVWPVSYGWSTRLTVVYSHGWDPVPEWIVGLVCSMVQRATRPAALNAVQSETTGTQTIAYNTSLAGVSLWLTSAEQDRLRSLKGPTIG